MPLKRVRYAQILPEPRYSDTFLRPAYHWIEKKLGYYPFFVSVAEDTKTIYTMTGFNACFKTRTTAYDSRAKKLVNCRNRDKPPNQVLFRFSRDGFEQLDYQDYDAWNFILNIFYGETGIPEYLLSAKGQRHLKRLTHIFLKPDWSEKKWYEKSRLDRNSVQATTPMLDLRKAEAVYCLTRKAQKYLYSLGFTNVIVYKARKFESPVPFR